MLRTESRPKKGVNPVVWWTLVALSNNCQNFVLSRIKRSWKIWCKQNKHKTRVAKACVFAKPSGRPRGSMRVCKSVPGHYLSPECVCWEVLACASPEPAEEGGANAGPEKAAKSRKRAGPGEALEGAYAAGITVDRFVQAEEHVVELGTAAEGDAQAGASTAEQMHMLLGAWPFCLLNGKLTCTIFCVCVTCPNDRTILCHIYY